MATDGEFRVMIAVDRSEQAEYAFDYYTTNVHRPGNKVFLIHVPEGPTTTTESKRHHRLDVHEWQRLMEKEQKETEELSNKYETKMKASQIDGTYKTFYGKPGEALCEAAKELDVKLVIVGTRGLGSVRRTILGSVSDFLIHHASVPVIVCRR